ncbi:MAG: NAD(P)/FAD-dependent oxidoreductase [Pseudomonadota bacterium]
MKKSDVIVIGAGQSGLAMSLELSHAGIEHLVLERGRVANSWRTERWASLRLLTPNWMNGVAGLPYTGSDPDGFMSVGAFVESCDVSARRNGAPIQIETSVLAVRPWGSGYIVETDQGQIACLAVVMANGACAIPRIPKFAQSLPEDIRHLTPLSYKSPDDVPDGKVLVVGASASGQQIAQELQNAGRSVTLSVGSHLRLPRDYRGADILFWMNLMGTFSVPHTDVDDLDRVRRLPSLPLVGTPSRATLDLNVLQDIGVEIVGRLGSVDDGRAYFSGSLHNHCAMADQKLARLLRSIDDLLDDSGHGHFAPMPEAWRPTRVPDAPRLTLDLARNGIKTVIWATGFAPDFSWLDMSVFDRKGRLDHDGGVVAPGLYAMGLPYMRTRKSTYIQGATDDARALSQHLIASFDARLAA